MSHSPSSPSLKSEPGVPKTAITTPTPLPPIKMAKLITPFMTKKEPDQGTLDTFINKHRKPRSSSSSSKVRTHHYKKSLKSRQLPPPPPPLADSDPRGPTKKVATTTPQVIVPITTTPSLYTHWGLKTLLLASEKHPEVSTYLQSVFDWLTVFRQLILPQKNMILCQQLLLDPNVINSLMSNIGQLCDFLRDCVYQDWPEGAQHILRHVCQNIIITTTAADKDSNYHALMQLYHEMGPN